jgi:hypothetical protein
VMPTLEREMGTAMQYSRELWEGSEDQRVKKKSARRRKQKKERERCFQPSTGGDS